MLTCYLLLNRFYHAAARLLAGLEGQARELVGMVGIPAAYIFLMHQANTFLDAPTTPSSSSPSPNGLRSPPLPPYSHAADRILSPLVRAPAPQTSASKLLIPFIFAPCALASRALLVLTHCLSSTCS